MILCDGPPKSTPCSPCLRGFSTALRWLCCGCLGAIAFLTCVAPVTAQVAPEFGYLHPAGGSVGTTVDVILGGYDWTPDMQWFSLEPRVTLEILTPPSEMLVAKPPYWFGPKARGTAFPIPRQIRARLTIPRDLPPGEIRLQAANANGATSVRRFVVSDSKESGVEIVEARRRDQVQTIGAVPATISGRLTRIEEVDRYRFRALRGGPVVCELFAKRLGSSFNGVLEVRDEKGIKIAGAADTQGRDTVVVFRAEANHDYTLSVHNLDFRGHRSMVYRLAIRPGPRVVTAIPPAVRRGTRQTVTFIGQGLATGADRLEQVTREVEFTANVNANEFSYQVETPHGTSQPFLFRVSDHVQIVRDKNNSTDQTVELKMPLGISGRFERNERAHRYRFSGKKGQQWLMAVESTAIGSPLDVTLTINDPKGKQIAHADDSGGTTDATVTATLPIDGVYEIVVGELSGRSGRLDSVYHLTITQPPAPDFQLSCPDRLSLPLGGKAELLIRLTRIGGFDGPINVTVSGLPGGVSVAKDLVIPAGGKELKIALQSDAGAAVVAAPIQVVAVAELGGQTVSRSTSDVLLAMTMKPRARVSPVDKDGGRTVRRGTIYRAACIVKRLEGFQGEVILQMAARQGRHRQGITGSDVVVAAGVTKVHYPVFMPEWLETSRTSRMVVHALTKVSDPQGNIRYLLGKMDGRITMSVEGSLLTLSHTGAELRTKSGESFDVSLTILRSAQLREPVEISLQLDEYQAGLFVAEPLTVAADQNRATLRIKTTTGARLDEEEILTIRAVVRKSGNLAVVAQTQVVVEIRRLDKKK